MFDDSAFRDGGFEPSTKFVTLSKTDYPALASFFKGDKAENPGFLVRGLSSAELAFAREGAAKASSAEDFIDWLSGGQDDIKKLMKQLSGFSEEDLPREYVQRLEWIERGSIEPKLSRPTVVLLADRFPTVFQVLSDTVLTLSGQGHKLKVKPEPSGETKTSE